MAPRTTEPDMSDSTHAHDVRCPDHAADVRGTGRAARPPGGQPDRRFVGASATAQRQDSTAWWTLGRQGRQQAGDCGIWVLDSRGYCVADDRRNGLEVGVRFRTSSPVLVTGVRLYRVDPSQLRVSLWDEQGNRIGSGLVTAGVANGWTDVAFDSPVQVGPGATYTASYFSPRTMYAFEYGFFADRTLTEGPVTALAHTEASPNGVHCYDDAVCGSYPVRGHRQSNYWVSPLWQRVGARPSRRPLRRGPPVAAVPRVRGRAPARLRGRARRPRGSSGGRPSPAPRGCRCGSGSPSRSAGRACTTAAVRLTRPGGGPCPARLTLSKDASRLVVSPKAALSAGRPTGSGRHQDQGRRRRPPRPAAEEARPAGRDLELQDPRTRLTPDRLRAATERTVPASVRCPDSRRRS